VELLGEHRYGICGVEHPEGQGTFLSAGLGDRWLYGFQYDPDREGPADFTAERFTRLIRLGAGAEVAGPLPIAVHALDRMSARAMGIPDGGALPARPDGKPVGWSPGRR